MRSITSTGLALVMVPAVFCSIDDPERWVSTRLVHRVAHVTGKPAPLGP